MSYDTVLVRAAAGKPQAMLAVSAGKGLVYVCNPSSRERVETGESWPVGVPEHDVFVFDRAAFEDLAREWKLAQRLDRERWRKYRLVCYTTTAGMLMAAG